MNFIGVNLQKNGVDVETVTGSQDKANSAESSAKSYSVNMISVGSTTDPNTTQEAYILTNHANGPGGGLHWHITTSFYSSKTGNRAQTAITYNGNAARYMIRHMYGSVWTSWTELGNTLEINKKANLASPTFTGTPKAPTAPTGTNTTQIATTGFVQAAVAVSGDNTFSHDGKAYRYSFGVNPETGGLTFRYEEI